MRLSWFTLSQLERRNLRARRRAARASLRVRQLERRRVLDGAVTSVVVSAVTAPVAPTASAPASSTTPTTPTTPAANSSPTEAVSKTPVVISVTPASRTVAPSDLHSDLAQGSAVNSPPVLVVQLDQNLSEGHQLDLSGTGGAPSLGLFLDADTSDTHTATVNWGDGVSESATVNEVGGVGTLGGTHVYTDQGTYSVTVTVDDHNGGIATGSFKAIVAPVNPTATFSNSGPVNEGAPSATVSFTNPVDPSSADTAAGFHYAYDLNNDGTFDIGDGTYGGSVTTTSQAVPVTFLAEGPSDHTVAGRIIDKDGQFTDYTTVLHVNNVAPTLTNISGDTINENSTATIKATIVDPSATDKFQVQVDWLDGTTATISGLGATDLTGTAGKTNYKWTAASRQIQLSHQYLDDGLSNAPSDTYKVSLTVKDSDGDMSGPYQAPVTVNDLPPVLVVPLTQNVFEGDTLNLSGAGGAPPLGLFVDTGTLDTHTATVNWGDSSATQNATVIQGVGAGALGGSHVYADDGAYTVTVTVTDKDGKSDSDTFIVNVANRDPVVTVPPGNQIVLEGTTLSLSQLARFTDAGFDNPSNPNPAVPPNITDPTHESFTYDINWGDGTGAVTGASVSDTNGGPGTPSKGTIAGSHTYADDGTYTVTVTVHDDNGGMGSASFQVVVFNQNPIVSAPNGNQTVIEGSPLTLSNLATFKDFGFDNPSNPNPATPQIADPQHETFTYDINWGDGRDAVTGASVGHISGSEGVPTSGSIAGSHTYADDGDYKVTITVHDDNGGVGSVSFNVHVDNANPVVSTPHGDQSIFEGDTVSFNNLATFTDAGFDNPANPNAAVPPNITDPKNESFTYDINWGDGTGAVTGLTVSDMNGGPGTPSNGTIAGSHTYADDGTYKVTITVHDDNGGVGTGSFNVTVANKNPVVTAPPGNQFVLEGTTLNFAQLAKFTDAGFDNPSNPNPAVPPNITDPKTESFTYDVDWGDGRDAIAGQSIIDTNGGPGTPSSGTISGSHTYADDGTYTVTITVHDDNGGVGSASFQVVVLNQNPIISAPHGNQTVTEGNLLSISDLATFKDFGFDNPSNPNPATPQITDPKNESFTYDINWGDGRDAVTGASVSATSGSAGVPSSGSIAGSHTYADDGDYKVTITVHDDNGGSDSVSFMVHVDNANPVVTTPHGDQSIFEGDTVSFSDLAKFTDPGSDNPANPNGAVPPNITDPKHESFTYDIDWGDGRNAVAGVSVSDTDSGPGTPSTGAISASHTYADDGKYKVTVTVHDDNGGVGTSSFFVTVANANPIVKAPNGDQSILEGGTVSFPNLATFEDAGFNNPSNPNPATPQITDPTHETFTYDINWGDGRDAVTGASVSDTDGGPGIPSKGTIAGTHTYADNGNYTVTVTVHDDNGGIGTVKFMVKVDNVEPTLTGTNGLNVNEGSAFTLNGLGVGVTDPGFDNPLNTQDPSNGGQVAETLSALSINWGDGTATEPLSLTEFQAQPFQGPTTATFPGASHTYADDGTYTVSVMIKDDDMQSFVTRTFQIQVKNVVPTLTTVGNQGGNQTLHESDLLSITNIGSLTDPGFNNPQNPLTPGGSVEVFRYFIDWGDGMTASTGAATIDNIGSVGIPTAASFDGSHVYADDGTYTVHVRVADDDMTAFTNAAMFSSGTNGVDYVEKTFTVTVTNVNPAFTPVDASHQFTGTDVNIKGNTTIQGSYHDPGFDNLNNQNLPLPGQTNITDINHESFTRVIDWGDGTVDAIHDYASSHNSNAPIVLTITGPGVNQTLNVTNFGSDENAVLRLVTHQDVTALSSQLYTFKVDWGNGTIQEFTLALKNPTFPANEAETLGQPNLPKVASTSIGPTTRISGNALTDTTGTFNITHNYTGPPDPLHSSAPIPISVTIVDDNNGTATASIEVKNPGINSVNIRIDTTPQVPRLVFAPLQLPQVFLNQATNAAQNLETTTVHLAPGEMMATSERYLELVVVSPEGHEMERYRLRDDAIADLRRLIATLPDNHYRIYLFRSDSGTRRLVIDVFVRHGRVIDPTDQSEGTRDRPPEGTQQQQPAQPLENNPLLQPITPGPTSSTQNEPASPADEASNAAAPAVAAEPNQAVPNGPPSSSRLRWALPLAGLSLAAGRGNWTQELEAAFTQADEQAWQRLRRAGRRRLVK